jgi:hypothetical protein
MARMANRGHVLSKFVYPYYATLKSQRYRPLWCASMIDGDILVALLMDRAPTILVYKHIISILNGTPCHTMAHAYCCSLGPLLTHFIFINTCLLAVGIKTVL